MKIQEQLPRVGRKADKELKVMLKSGKTGNIYLPAEA